MKKILFTVCNYNAHATGALDKSLKRLRDIKDDGVVISYFDNASKDGSEDVLHEYYKSGLIDVLVLSRKNMGKAYAMNKLFIMTAQMYCLAKDDVLVSMDSDISIMDKSLPAQVRSLFAAPGVKFLGYTYFSDEDMKTKGPYNYYQTDKQELIGGRHYDVLKTQHGLGGGILAMPMSRFTTVNGYNQHLGPGGAPALYGGDDAVLIRDLFLKFPKEKALCCTDQMIVHPEDEDKAYIQWKRDVIKSMCRAGFKNKALPQKGFYD